MAKVGKALLRDVAIPANGNIPIEIFAAQAAARRRLAFPLTMRARLRELRTFQVLRHFGEQ
jgi:hypothetical protein